MLPRHHRHTVLSVAGSFYTRDVGVLAEVTVTEQVVTGNFHIARNPGKTEHAQCVPGSFLPTHT